MSGGLVALLDDMTGVVVDDTAVPPRYVQGIDPRRELPIIKRITIGSLRNKLLFIVPAILVLNEFLPWLLSPLLMLGGTYLCFEGMEKIWEKLSGHGQTAIADEDKEPADEEKIVKGAVTPSGSCSRSSSSSRSSSPWPSTGSSPSP